MKKFLAILLAAMMIFSLAACGETSGDTTGDGATSGAAETDNVDAQDDVELESFKLGIICHTNSGGCWDRIFDAATYVSESLNCTISAAVGSSAESVLSAAENFIAAGCDGLILLADGGVTSRLIDLCSEAGVYLIFSGCNLTVTEEEGFEEFSKNEYYCGNIAHDEYQDAYDCIQMMVDNGAENFVIYGLPPGIASNFDLRVTGAEDAIEAAGGTYTEVRSYTLSEVSSTVMSQYPDTDAIFSFVTTPDSFNVEDFASQYGDSVQVSGYMCGDVTNEFEIGFLDYVCVGEEAQVEMSIAVLYNALCGNRMAEEDGTAPVIEFSHLWIDNVDDYKTFINATTGGNYAYDIETVNSWISAYGNEVTIDELAEIAAQFSDTSENGWLAGK